MNRCGDPQPDYAERENLEHTALNEIVPSNPAPLKPGRGGGKNVIARGDGTQQENKTL